MFPSIPLRRDRRNGGEHRSPVLPAVSVSKKLACGDLFRQDTFPLRLRRGRGNVQGNLAAQGFRIHRTCRWIRISFGGDGGKRVPCGAEGSASPVGCCHRRWQSDPERGSETMSTTVRKVRMIEQPGHLAPKGPKRPGGVNRNERRARPASAATIEVADLRPSEPPQRVF